MHYLSQMIVIGSNPGICLRYSKKDEQARQGSTCSVNWLYVQGSISGGTPQR